MKSAKTLTATDYAAQRNRIESDIAAVAEEHREASYRLATGQAELSEVKEIAERQRDLQMQLDALNTAQGVAADRDAQAERDDKVRRYRVATAEVSAIFDRREAAARQFAEGLAMIASAADVLSSTGEEIIVAANAAIRISSNWRRDPERVGRIRTAVAMNEIAEAVGKLLWDAGVRFRRTDYRFADPVNLAAIAGDSRETVMSTLEAYAPQEEPA